MKPLEGMKDDLVDYVGRLREQCYPELTNADVHRVLQGVARLYLLTNTEAQARAFAGITAAAAGNHPGIEHKLQPMGSGPQKASDRAAMPSWFAEV